jgi:hypothetical protein
VLIAGNRAHIPVGQIDASSADHLQGHGFSHLN